MLDRISDGLDVELQKGAYKRAILSLEMMGPPQTAEFAPGSEKIARIGNIAVARAAWGTRITNSDFFQAMQSQGVLTEELIQRIEAIGFSSGYYFSPRTDINSDRFQDLHAGYAAKLAERVVKEREWSGVDLLIVASLSSSAEIAHMTAERLLSAGISCDQAVMYAQACNGPTAAIADVIRDQRLKGEKVAIVGVDSLSGSMSDLMAPGTFRTFGNGGGAIAFVADKEIRFVSGRTIIEYDAKGVIEGWAPYQVPDVSQRIQPPEWYEVIGAETPDHFACSEKGVFLVPPKSTDGKAHMNARGTLALFEGKMVPLGFEQFQKYRELGSPYGPLGKTWSHQPSEGVIVIINRSLVREVLISLGYGKSDANSISKKSLVERGKILDDLGIVVPEIEWFNGRTSINNISSGTSLVCAVEMAEQGLLRQGQANLMLGYGIGAAFTANVIYFP